MSKERRTIALIPLFLAIALALGFGAGTQVGEPTLDGEDKETVMKLKVILDYVENNYVDEVNPTKLMESSIGTMLSELDPHSMYIPARNTTEYNEDLRGYMFGVGVQFKILNDTLTVRRVIERGPSHYAGVKAGDRIIEVDGEEITNIGLTNQDVMDKLKGPQGSRVKVVVYRKGETKQLNITRGQIPLKSVEAYYMLNETTGYIHLTKFSQTTTQEFLSAVNNLREQGMRELVFDLRGNNGGYLSQAVNLADEMLSVGDLIVYTQGRKRSREDYYSQIPGRLEHMPITILINENSASASEILAGAVQDNDRGLIVGRRSFGKGLVQEPKTFADGSELRLTIARYYTPSGRSIQRPYGHGIDYAEAHYDRFENGELYAVDSSWFADSLKYETLKKKRPVYGGGGIMPDHFVPFDTSDMNNSFRSLAYIMDEFAFYYLDAHRDSLTELYPNFRDFGLGFQVSDDLFEELVETARSKPELKLTDEETQVAKWRIKYRLKEDLASDLYGFVGRSYILSFYDPVIQEALKVTD